MNAVADLRAGGRVLVTRLNYLGDVVLSLPLIDALHARHPGIEIDYLSRSDGADLLTGDPRIARVHRLRPGPAAFLPLVRALRARRYRAVIDLYSNPRSAWLSCLSGAPVRVGGNRRGRRHLYTHPVSVPRGVRRVTDVFMHYGEPLGVFPPAGVPALPLSADEIAAADTLVTRVAGAGVPRVGVHPGGKWPVKRWPAEKFGELVERFRADGMQVVLFTGPAEREVTAALGAAHRDGVHALPVLGIRALAAVVSRLDAMVACDGGVMHVSAAVGTPTVGIFGSSEPDIWFPYPADGPYQAAHIDVPCRPCHRHVCPLGHTRCLNELPAGVVYDLVLAVKRGPVAGATP
jgi:lipopolysaccharide heptosyltransferase II